MATPNNDSLNEALAKALRRAINDQLDSKPELQEVFRLRAADEAKTLDLGLLLSAYFSHEASNQSSTIDRLGSETLENEILRRKSGDPKFAARLQRLFDRVGLAARVVGGAP